MENLYSLCIGDNFMSNYKVSSSFIDSYNNKKATEFIPVALVDVTREITKDAIKYGSTEPNMTKFMFVDCNYQELPMWLTDKQYKEGKAQWVDHLMSMYDVKSFRELVGFIFLVKVVERNNYQTIARFCETLPTPVDIELINKAIKNIQNKTEQHCKDLPF